MQENNSPLYTVWIVTVLSLLLRRLYLSKTGSEVGAGKRRVHPFCFNQKERKEAEYE